MPPSRPGRALTPGEGPGSPKPEELRQDRSDQAVDEDVGPHHLAGQLKGLEARVMEQQEAGPQQEQVEEAHKPWEREPASASYSRSGNQAARRIPHQRTWECRACPPDPPVVLS